MKKFLATLMTLALLLTSAAGLAETVPEINWEMVDIESTGIEGDWYTLNAVALQIWIPDTFEAAEITEEDGPGVVVKFMAPDGTAGIFGQLIEGYEGATTEDMIERISANGATDIERCILNGLDAVSYSIPDTDAAYVAFVTASGNFMQFVFVPVSDEGFSSLAQIVTASIMPEQ